MLPEYSLVCLYSRFRPRPCCPQHSYLRRGTMTAANVGAGARISLIVVLREEGERAAAEDVQLDREERRNAASLRPTQGVQLAD